MTCARLGVCGGTIRRSMRETALHVGTMALGVAIAFLTVAAVPWVPVALGVAVFTGMLVGRWRRLGPDGIWVGAVALLMITYTLRTTPVTWRSGSARACSARWSGWQ